MKSAITTKTTSNLTLRPSSWTIKHLVMGVALTTIGAVLPSAFLILVGNNPASAFALPLQYFLMFIIGTSLMYVFGGKKKLEEHFGLTVPRAIMPFVYAIIGGILFVLLAQIFAPLIPSVKEGSETVAKSVAINSNLLQSMVIVISLAIAAPIGEELAYRGIVMRSLYDILSRKMTLMLSVIISVAISSLLFAISHGGAGQSAQIWFLTVAGIIYASVYLKTGSLSMAMLAHSVSNTINVFLLINVAAKAGEAVSPIVYITAVAAPFIVLGIGQGTAKIISANSK